MNDSPTEENLADTEVKPMPAPGKRGFAAMSPERLKQVTSKGGKEAHAVGLANRFTSESAGVAGKLGGAKTSADRAHMSEIGRRGGLARRKKPVAQPTDDPATAPPIDDDPSHEK